jgi:hypothetical protein
VAGSDGAIFYRAHINLGDLQMCPNGYWDLDIYHSLIIVND